MRKLFTGTTLRMLFEVEDCAVASPATVSRLGVVWIPPEGTGSLAFPTTWLATHVPKTCPDELRDLLSKLITDHMEAAILCVRRDCKEGGITSMDNNLATSLCRMLEVLFLPDRGLLPLKEGGEEGELDFSFEGAADLFKRWFLFSLVWSIGGNLVASSKEIFSEYVREKLSSVTRFPNAGTVYDYCVDTDSKAFMPWEEVTPKFNFNKDQPYSSILVPTKDTVRFSYLIEAFTAVNRGTQLIGESGTGKSVIMVDCLNQLAEAGTFLSRQVPGNIVPFTINFSAQTSSPRTQEMLELRFEKKRKGEGCGMVESDSEANSPDDHE